MPDSRATHTIIYLSIAVLLLLAAFALIVTRIPVDDLALGRMSRLPVIRLFISPNSVALRAERLYLAGFDLVEYDKQQAVEYIREAAELGCAPAQSALGSFCVSGDGVEQDTAEAVKWFRRAAEQGFPEAQYNLGISYMKGRGVEQDTDEAVKWFRKAADLGFPPAQNNLGLYCLENGREAEGVELFRKAAEHGLASAMHNLAFCYGEGRGVEKDPAEGTAKPRNGDTSILSSTLARFIIPKRARRT